MTRAALALALLLAGCSSTPDVGVRPAARGRGAVVGPRRVVTVQHVAAGQALVGVLGQRARRVAAYPFPADHPRAGDGVVVLELEDEGARLGGAVQRWRPLIPGDSGSPLYDADGACVGLFLGWEGHEDRSVGAFVPCPAGGWE